MRKNKNYFKRLKKNYGVMIFKNSTYVFYKIKLPNESPFKDTMFKEE